MSRTIQPPTMHTKLVAASISDMVQEWYQGKCEVPPMQADTFERRISRFQPDIAAHVAAEVAKARAEIYAQIEAMPRREELMGGQRTEYIQLHEALAWIGAKP